MSKTATNSFLNLIPMKTTGNGGITFNNNKLTPLDSSIRNNHDVPDNISPTSASALPPIGRPGIFGK